MMIYSAHSNGQSDNGKSGVDLPPLISALLNAACFDHATETITVLQTHISYVLLTGTYAYKIKKPVTLPFLDFSSLEFRKHYCDEELRINQRLAPDLYLGVVAITGTPQAPVVNGNGRVIEYAVKMVQFPDADRLDRVAERGELGADHIRALARTVASFHDTVAIAGISTPFADSVRLRREVMENFATLASQTLPGDAAALLEDLRGWSTRVLVDLGGHFRARKRAGAVRECHGDMHLANMALLNDQVIVFDALEFNENLRWIDVLSELAFLVMDLEYRGLPGLGWLVFSIYLEHSGDYAGLRVFRHYKVYRAMVRAKVAALRAQQCESRTPEAREAGADLVSHIRLAHSYLQENKRPPLVITHGLSGSGKSWLATQLVQVLGAICVRSDVERQRLVTTGKIPADERYTAAATDQIYRTLVHRARTIVDCGFPAIIDATFLKRRHRLLFLELARELGVPFVILELHAPQEVLEARIAKRQSDGTDPSEATIGVLLRQREELDPLNSEERKLSMNVGKTSDPAITLIAERILRGRPAPWTRRLEESIDEEC